MNLSFKTAKIQFFLSIFLNQLGCAIYEAIIFGKTSEIIRKYNIDNHTHILQDLVSLCFSNKFFSTYSFKSFFFPLFARFSLFLPAYSIS